MKPKVKFENVSKSYVFYKKQFHKLLDLFRFRKKSKEFYALQGISFEVFHGESIGVVGINGSGKSTLSNLLAQVTEPTSGSIKLEGDSSLIAIAAGLNNNLSGLENIELKCLMLGIHKSKIEELIPEIIEFADVGEFISQPVKNYSSGMKSRLGFAISAYTNPDIVIIDEALSVGDSTFYEKCLKKIEEFKRQGKTIFFISHSIGQIRSFSDRVMWLHFGKLKEFGDKKEVLQNYKEFISWFNELSEVDKKQYRKDNLSSQLDFGGSDRLGKRTKKIRVSKRIRDISMIFFGVMLLTFAVLQMFEVKTSGFINTIYDQTLDRGGETPDQSIPQEIIPEILEEEAIASKEKVKIFKDRELKGDTEEIPFGTEVFAKEKIGKEYSIEYNGQLYYTKNTNVEILKESKDFDVSVRDMLEFLPEIFTNSYSYYLAFLEATHDEIKDKLLELTDEGSDDFGRDYLEYSFDKVTYHFNEDGKADSITIQDIDLNNDFLNQLLQESSVVSNQNRLYYLTTKEYKIVINAEDRTMKLTLRKEKGD
ncbi:ATP-binding cassette domain-containing protein [Rossellomorea marisflavi]|uniref:ATP-binding cassette domain-containing protein n=1 Tax=Rossellomorea marisflavi TaxID=189381 RepID=UPI0013167301|nr:ATP-binding cassette domain-containing protein [Rossellomorea marisflavi]QHA37887.1 ATP-binding cassette domain-containing protein [Rossellomorea marisflavi]